LVLTSVDTPGDRPEMQRFPRETLLQAELNVSYRGQTNVFVENRFRNKMRRDPVKHHSPSENPAGRVADPASAYPKQSMRYATGRGSGGALKVCLNHHCGFHPTRLGPAADFHEGRALWSSNLDENY
jgi:hypothetical protein